MAKSLFTAEELKRIKTAVQEAEAKTNGEIVPVFTRQSDFYEVALWRCGFALSLLAAAGLLVTYYTTDVLLYAPHYFWILTIIAAGFLGAALTMWSSGLRRMFAGKELLRDQALAKAQSQFLTHGVFNTQQRIGIMIFISFFERQVVVMADEGINAYVEQDQWNSVVSHIGEKLKKNQKADAIVGAIAECARLLEESPIEILPTENEIDDDLRIEE